MHILSSTELLFFVPGFVPFDITESGPFWNIEKFRFWSNYFSYIQGIEKKITSLFFRDYPWPFEYCTN